MSLRDRLRRRLLGVPLAVKIGGVAVVSVLLVGAAVMIFVDRHVRAMAGGPAAVDRLRFELPFLATIAAGAAAAALASAMLTRTIVSPVRSLLEAVRRIASGHYEVEVPHDSRDEIGELADGIREMATRLAEARDQVELRARERREMIARLVASQERERQAIARELHDHFGQMLSLLLLLTESLRRADDRSRREALLARIEDHVRSVIDDVRRLSSDLRPAILDDLGLEAALERHIETLRATGAFDVEFDCGLHAGERFGADVESAVFRIAQEALSNAVRHAGARRVSVRLEHDRDGALVLEVSDDGRGLPEGLGTGRFGLGLSTMRERAEMVGGRFTIDGAPGAGTRVSVRIPPAAGSPAASSPTR